MRKVSLIAAACAATLAGLFSALTVTVSAHPERGAVDSRLLSTVANHRSGALTALAKVTTTLGTGYVVYPVLAAAGVILWWRRGRWLPGAAALAFLLAGQGVRLAVNRGVARPRPPQSLHLVNAWGDAFPSGHTTTATIGYGLTALLLLKLASSGRRRYLMWAPAVVIAACVGGSRVYLGVHWPSDVLGGWLLGAAWVALAAAIQAAFDQPSAEAASCSRTSSMSSP